MTEMTRYLQKKLLDHTLGLASYTMPTAWLGLATADPGETGSFAGEPSGNGYARQNLTTTMSATSLTTGVSSNVSVITFGPCTTTTWGTITHGHVDDASGTAGGNCLLYGGLSSARAVTVGNSLPFAAAAFSITFA